MVVREALNSPCTFISDAVFAQVHKVNKLDGLYLIVLCCVVLSAHPPALKIGKIVPVLN
jgi:hypothetical protein